MEYPTYACDVCGKEKGEANHWFAVRALNELLFTVKPWEEAETDGTLSNDEHICGAECLHKRLSQWLEINSRTVPIKTQEEQCQEQQ